MVLFALLLHISYFLQEFKSSQAVTRYEQALHKKTQELIHEKYFDKFNFYFAKPVNEILANAFVPHVITFKDYLYYDDDREFLKRYYQRQEFSGKLHILSDFYDQNFHQMLPNLCIHEQNKIVLKRNLKLHKIFINRINEHGNIPQTARMNNSPTYKRNAALLAKHYGDESESEMDSEPEKKYSPRDRDFQPVGGEGGQSFQKMLERFENNHSRGSYETTMHDIYGDGSSSRGSSKPKNPPKNKEITDRKFNNRQKVLEEEKDEGIRGNEHGNQGLEDYFYNEYEDSGVDFDLLRKNANNRKELYSEGQSLTLTNLHESFHKLNENLFADEHVSWVGMSSHKAENSDIYAVEEFFNPQFENRSNHFQENRATASSVHKKEQQGEKVQASKPTQQHEIPPLKMNTESLTLKKGDLAQLKQQQLGYSPPNRDGGHKPSDQKTQKSSGSNSQVPLTVTAKTLKNDTDTKKITELIQKTKTLKPSPSEVNLRLDAMTKNLAYNDPSGAQTHRQFTSQPIPSPKKTPSSAQKFHNTRKITKEEPKLSAKEATKAHFKFPSEFVDEKARQALTDISKNGPASRMSKDSLATTASLNKQSQQSSSHKASGIEPNLSNGKIPGVGMTDAKPSNAIKPENSSELRSNPSTRTRATPVTSFKEQNTQSQQQNRGIANTQLAAARKLNQHRVISNEGLSNSNTLSAINQYLLSSANSLNSSKSNQDSLTSPERLFSTVGGKIERAEGLLSYPDSKTQSRPSTSNKGSFKGSLKKESPGQKTDRPLSTRAHTSGEAPLKLHTTSTTALKGREVLAKGKNDNKMKLDLGQIKKKGSLNSKDDSEENNPGFWSSRSGKAGYDELDSHRGYPTKTEENLYGRNSSKENLGKGLQKPNGQEKGNVKTAGGKGLSQEQFQLERYREVLLRSSLMKQANQNAADVKKVNTLGAGEKRMGTPLSQATKKTSKLKK